MAIVRRKESAKWRWPLLISVFLLNVCLPTLVLSYGVLLVQSLEIGVPIALGLATPTLFVVTFCFTQCWFREAADSWGGSLGYRTMAAFGLILVVISLLVCTFIPYNLYAYVYGVIGGLGVSLVAAQADAVVFESYDSRLGTIRAICFAGQAIGLAIFPHVITALVYTFGYSLAHMLLAGIMLQCLPMIMMLKVDETVTNPVSFSRYGDAAKTYAMVDYQTKNNYLSVDVHLQDMSKKSWKSPSDNNVELDRENISNGIYNQEFMVTTTPPPSPEENRRMFGFDILPDIPEVSEDSDIDDNDTLSTHKKRFSFAIKRLSNMGDSIGECINNQIRRVSLSTESREDHEFEIHTDNVSPRQVQREFIVNSFSFRCQSAFANMRRKLGIPSYRLYIIRRKSLYILYSINDTLIKPLIRSLTFWKFYPSLILMFSKFCLASIMLVMLPLVAYEIKPKISTYETNFMISLYAFTWLCFLLGTPWLGQTAKRNYIYVTAAGLIVSCISSYVLAFSTTHDMFSIGCVIGGFGYGSVISCADTAIQDFVGSRQWPKIHSTLETLSGLLLAAFLTVILFLLEEPYGLQYSLFILGILLSISSLIWLVLSGILIYTTKIKYARIRRG